MNYFNDVCTGAIIMKSKFLPCLDISYFIEVRLRFTLLYTDFHYSAINLKTALSHISMSTKNALF